MRLDGDEKLSWAPPRCLEGEAKRVLRRGWEIRPDDKYPNAASNPWCAEDYTQVPRGRIYTDGETFFVYVGTWFDKDSEHITSLIMATYGLDEENTRFVHNRHWNVGNGWEALKIRKRRYRGNPKARKRRKQK